MQLVSSFVFAAPFLLAGPSLALHSLSAEALHSLSVGAEGTVSTVQQPFNFGRRTNQRITLENFHDVHYSAQIRVGGQNIMAVVDTGAYELMVFDQNIGCGGCIGSTASLFDRRESDFLRIGEWTAEHDFLGGHTFSTLARDHVRLGSRDAEDQYFWLVTSAFLPALEFEAFQAIMGLAPPGQPLRDAAHTAIQTQYAAQQANASGVTDPGAEQWMQDSADFYTELHGEDSLLESLDIDVFSICLEPHLGGPGYLLMEEEVPDLSDETNVFYHLPVVGLETWTATMSRATLGTTVVGCEGGCAVVFDTASPLISVPQDVFDRVQAALEGLDVDCTHISSLPTLTLTIGDTVLTLPPDTYMGEVFGEVSEALSHFWPNPAVGLRTCRPLLMVFDAPTQWGPLWVMGMPFFRSHYTIFELAQTNETTSSIYVAPQTGEVCERPAQAELSLWEGRSGEVYQANTTSLDRQAALLKLDLAKLRPPRWAAAAAAGKAVKL